MEDHFGHRSKPRYPPQVRLCVSEFNFRIGKPSDKTTVTSGIRRHPPGTRGKFGEARWAIDSQVDRAFLIEVLLTSAAQSFLRAAHHEQLLPKFGTSIRFAKGVLCPEKSIRSIKSSTVR